MSSIFDELQAEAAEVEPQAPAADLIDWASDEVCQAIIRHYEEDLAKLVSGGRDGNTATRMVDLAIGEEAVANYHRALREYGSRHILRPMTRAEMDRPSEDFERFIGTIDEEIKLYKDTLGKSETSAWSRAEATRPNVTIQYRQAHAILSERLAKPAAIEPDRPQSIDMKKSDLIVQAGSVYAPCAEVLIRFAKPFSKPPVVVATTAMGCRVLNITEEGFDLLSTRAPTEGCWIATLATQTNECVPIDEDMRKKRRGF